MSKKNNGVYQALRTPTLAWVTLFGLLIIIPLIGSLFLTQVGILVQHTGQAAGIIAITFATMLFVIFLLLAVLIQSLVYAFAHHVNMKKKPSIIALAKDACKTYWRVMLWDILMLIILIPGGIALIFAVQPGTVLIQTILLLASVLWALLVFYSMIWGPALLQKHKALDSLKKSFKLAFSKRKQSMRVASTIFLLALVPAVAYVAVLFARLSGEAPVLAASVFSIQLTSTLLATHTFVPAYFMQVGGGLFWQLVVLVIQLVVLALGTSVIYAAAKKAKYL